MDKSVINSYKQQEKHYDKFVLNGEINEHAETWFTPNNVDQWRHLRMYDKLLPLIKAYPNAKWITIGDGRMGNDAHYLETKGIDVLATDISDVLLKKAFQTGYIKKYKKENAEMIDQTNDSFDFVLCKESYHHFPRPYLALYEMLRVAKKGIILIEPNDHYVDSKFFQIPLRNLKNFLRKKIKNRNFVHDFEESGNYVYRISKRELEKVAYGINLPNAAFLRMNDHFINGIAKINIGDKNPLFTKLKFIINFQNILCKLGILQYTLLVSILFKMKPDENLRKDLLRTGFEVVNILENPYQEKNI